MATPPVGASSRDNTKPCVFDRSWAQLNESERAAAVGLGWKNDGADWRSGPAADRWNNYATMESMKEEDRKFWRILGLQD